MLKNSLVGSLFAFLAVYSQEEFAMYRNYIRKWGALLLALLFAPRAYPGNDPGTEAPHFIAYAAQRNFFPLPLKKTPYEMTRYEILDGPRGLTIDRYGMATWTAPLDHLGATFPLILKVLQVEGSFGAKVSRYDIGVRRLSRVAIVMAHQDDELGIGLKLQQLVRDHRVGVHGIWLAGAPHGTAKFSCAQRSDETREAMRILGIPRERLHFYCYEDQRVGANAEDILPRLRGDLAAIKPEVIFVSAYEGGHMDHDMTHYLTRLASLDLPNSPQIYEFPLYNRKGINPIHAFLPIRATAPEVSLQNNIPLLERLMRAYPSQKAIVRLLHTSMRAFPESRRFMRYRPVPNWNYTVPPARRPLSYEVNILTKGTQPKDFHQAYRQHVQRLVQGRRGVATFVVHRPSEQDLLGNAERVGREWE